MVQQDCDSTHAPPADIAANIVMTVFAEGGSKIPTAQSVLLSK
jgi:hypothetical protein